VAALRDAILPCVTGERALLVDVPDEAIERELAEAGFTVARAASVDEAVFDDVDVLVLRLGERRPLETFSVARSVADDRPIVVLTEPGRSADGQAALRAGAEDHVSRDELVPGLLPRTLRYAIDQRRMRNELRELEITDELTGLPNLRGFVPVAEHRFRIADRDRVPVVLVFVRLDDLDDLQTEGGANEADEVAIDAANVILEGVRDADYPGRVATDTFCVLLSGHADGTEAIVLSRLVEAIAVRNTRSDRPRRLSLSIGTAVYDPDHPATIEEIVETARRRMRRHPIDEDEPEASAEAAGPDSSDGP